MADAAAELVKQKRISGFLLNFKRNTVRLAASARTLPHMRTRLSLLETYWSEYTQRDLVLQANRSAFKGEAYFENDEYLEVESSYVESKADMFQLIEDLEIAARPPVTVTGAQNNQVVHAPPVPGPSEFANMPKCQIPKFSGKAEEWETFKEQFSSMVKNKANLPDAIKMQYLVDSVEGPAALRVKGLPLTGASFELAWQKLMRRYDNPTRRMHTYMELLIDMKPVKLR
ncbi:uncharacterized protein LOC116417890 [Nasonia vitripennis]|uniref:Gag protein n=1 Tax=Nasonia vitripennis TaxID=7425 RepID=A0A7M7QLS4_NASVI|nr:uncharacterized protein LOC116417890 [Nasonia vitripennis]